MIIRFGTLSVIVSRLVSLFYKILLNEISNFKDRLISYDEIIDVLNNINTNSNYDKIIKQNIEQLINNHFISDDKDCYITIDFPLVKIMYSKLDSNKLLTDKNTHFLDTMKIEFPNVNSFKDIIQPLHSIINNSSYVTYVDEEFLNRLTIQEYLSIEEHILNIMSKHVDYLNYQLLMLIVFKMSKIMVNNNNKMLGIVTIDKNITCDENYSYTYKWVYGIFDVSTIETENVMKLHINYLSKKYNDPDIKIQYEYIPIIPTKTST
jgi:hypothetical protein